ncbi:MAG: hypothetical protein CM1200mP20_12330 [Pseudomonadota bacterium]|nr:MAG: hypothetical protein CM1200mP20_12330 [Pseudomonadota bacterium]
MPELLRHGGDFGQWAQTYGVSMAMGELSFCLQYAIFPLKAPLSPAAPAAGSRSAPAGPPAVHFVQLLQSALAAGVEMTAVRLDEDCHLA